MGRDLLLERTKKLFSFFVFLLRHPRPTDNVVVKTDPLLLSVSGALYQALVGFRMVARWEALLVTGQCIMGFPNGPESSKDPDPK
jgi:hypothetical protein